MEKYGRHFYRARKRNEHKEYAERLAREIPIVVGIGNIRRAAENAYYGVRRRFEQQRCDKPHARRAHKNGAIQLFHSVVVLRAHVVAYYRLTAEHDAYDYVDDHREHLALYADDGGTEQIDHAYYKRHCLTYNGRPRRARLAPLAREYEHGVEYYVHDRAREHGKHRPGRTAVGAHNGVYHVGQHVYREKRQNYVKVLDGVAYAVLGRAEQRQHLRFERIEQREQYHAYYQRERHARAHATVILIGIALALVNVYVRGAPVAEVPSKPLRDYEYGEHNAGSGVAERAQLAVTDENLVDDVIQRAHEQRENARNTEFSHQLGNFFRA